MLEHSPLSERQWCKVCGRHEYFAFDVPDDVWANIVPEEHVCHVVCLACFDDFASAAGKKYAKSFRCLYFAGNAASFKLIPETVVDCVGQ